MNIWIFCTACERASSIETTNSNLIGLNKFDTVSEVIIELESQLGSSEYAESPYTTCYYEDCDSKPQQWVFWDDHRLKSGEGLNWPITPELNIFYQI